MSKKVDNQKNQRIQVFARCRPLNSIEKKQGSFSVVEVIPEKKEIVLKDRNSNREFFFDKVFPPDTKQISVYKSVVEPLIKEVLMGYNCTVFAYGQTGTGKTYTMEGERNNSQCSWEDDPAAGIIPRSLHQLFEELNKEENVEFSVRVSFLELYNEELFDLLSSTELSRLRLYEDTNRKGSVIIQGLEEIIVNNKDEVYSILEKGTARRQTAATMLNATSSRSHTVFSVTIHIKENTIDGEELLKTGKLNLVDLAGSENVGRSGAIDKRAREAGNINQSLLTLGRVITALIEKQPHVPYRESKLTRLLQDSLGGHTKTSIIATISPALCNFDETISTLDYATKAKSITIKPEVNQKMTKRALIREYTEEIERLRKDLVALRSKEGFYIDLDNYTNMMNSITEKTELIKELSDKIEALTEENTKIEEMFNSTKEELSKTSTQLDETTHKFKETSNQLSKKIEALAYIQQVLSKTTLERDEKEYLVNIQKNIEKKLSNQAHALLQVADQSTGDNEKLHAKLDRKERVEKTNEERCQEFRITYQKHIAKLDDMVSETKDHQIKNLENIRDNINNMLIGYTEFQEYIQTCLQDILAHEKSQLHELSSNLNRRSTFHRQWLKTTLLNMKSKKDEHASAQQTFVSEFLPTRFAHLAKMNELMGTWFYDMYKDLCLKISQSKNILEEQSAKRKELYHTMSREADSFCNRHEQILAELKEHTLSLSNSQSELDEMKKGIITLLNNCTQMQENLKKHTTKLESDCINMENNGKEFRTFELHLNELQTSEEKFESDLCLFEDISKTIKIEELPAKQESILQSQHTIATEISEYFQRTKKLQEQNHEECKIAFENEDSALIENLENNENKINDITSSLSKVINEKEKIFEKHNQTIREFAISSETVATNSTKRLNQAATELKEEILKRDLEFEKFISEDLVKDIPTGTTPQRKTFIYPKVLAATSPHDRILQRYRSQLDADTAIAVNLPLNTSFDEREESKTPPYKDVSIELNSQNASFRDENDSTGFESDSNASTVSDISVESFRHKENSKSNKKSKLPKRQNKFKGFTKPAPIINRKPLQSHNPDVN